MKEQAVTENQFNTLLKAPQIVAKPLCAIFKKKGGENKTKQNKKPAVWNWEQRVPE